MPKIGPNWEYITFENVDDIAEIIMNLLVGKKLAVATCTSEPLSQCLRANVRLMSTGGVSTSKNMATGECFLCLSFTTFIQYLDRPFVARPRGGNTGNTNITRIRMDKNGVIEIRPVQTRDEYLAHDQHPLMQVMIAVQE